MSASNWPSSNGSARHRLPAGAPSSSPRRARRAGALLEHLGALVDADDEAVLLAHELAARRRPCRWRRRAPCRSGRRRCARRGSAASAGPGRTRAPSPSGRSVGPSGAKSSRRIHTLDSMALGRRPGADRRRRGGARRGRGRARGGAGARPAALPVRVRRRTRRARWLVLDEDGAPSTAATTCATPRRSSRCASSPAISRAAATSRAALAARAGADGRAAARDRGGGGGGARARAHDRRAAARRDAGLPRRGRRSDDGARTGARRDLVAVLGGDPRRDRRGRGVRRATSSAATCSTCS